VALAKGQLAVNGRTSTADKSALQDSKDATTYRKGGVELAQSGTPLVPPEIGGLPSNLQSRTGPAPHAHSVITLWQLTINFKVSATRDALLGGFGSRGAPQRG
jgi:hypothetical protein